MPLRDLTITKSQLTEKHVEEVIADYMRYDPDFKEIVLLPAAHSLSNKSKILVYLVALQGWSFVTDQPIPTDATPAQIGQVLNIPGGTLRPILKELKDQHLISARGRSYSVRVAALPQVKTAIGGGDGTQRGTSRSKPRKGRQTARVARQAAVKKSKGPRRSLSPFFDALISQGFFDSPRTLNDIVARFHQKGFIVPRTSVPQYLLKAIRPDDGRLRRERREVNGKSVWVYQKAN